MAISPANQDIATSDAIKLAREVDPTGITMLVHYVPRSVDVFFINQVIYIPVICWISRWKNIWSGNKTRFDGQGNQCSGCMDSLPHPLLKL